MDFANIMLGASIKKYSLARRGLAGVNVGNNAEISDSFQRIISFHKLFIVSVVELPCKMSEGLVGFRHFMSVLPLSDSIALIIGSGNDFLR